MRRTAGKNYIIFKDRFKSIDDKLRDGYLRWPSLTKLVPIVALM
jgi:hypothetical protein